VDLTVFLGMIRMDWTSRKSTLKGSRNIESHCGRGGGGGGGLLQSKAFKEADVGRDPKLRILTPSPDHQSYEHFPFLSTFSLSLSLSLSHTHTHTLLLSHTHVPFPPRRTGRYRKGMISGRPSYQGVRRSVWDLETFARAGDTSHAKARLEGAAT